MKLKNVADIIFSFPTKDNSDFPIYEKWLTTASLLEYNEIGKVEKSCEWKIDRNYRVYKGDIIMKRVRPQYVNYINKDIECYIGQNLAIIRANELVHSKYLAYIIDNNIKSLGVVEVGSVVPAIKRKDMEELDIGVLPSMRVQKAIGELWWLQKEKIMYSKNLIELEEKILNKKIEKLLKDKGELL